MFFAHSITHSLQAQQPYLWDQHQLQYGEYVTANKLS